MSDDEDNYFFDAVFCPFGILVLNKDIKEVYNQLGRSDENTEPCLKDSLFLREIDWVIDQCNGSDRQKSDDAGFDLYQICDTFVLITKQTRLHDVPMLRVEVPHKILDKRLHCQVMPVDPEKPDEYDSLVAIARRLTPEGNKLSFPPGEYSFSSGHECSYEKLKNWRSKASTTGEKKYKWMPDAYFHDGARIPSDFQLVVGSGEKQKTIDTGKALLSCYLPKFDDLVGDIMKTDNIALQDLDPDMVEIVLEFSTTRKQVVLPFQCDEEDRIAETTKVLQTFGLEVEDETYQTQTKKLKIDTTDDMSTSSHPALTDPRWLDATFLAGQEKTEIKVCRAVLASMNPVLHRILFGTGCIPAFTSAPIEWPQYDAETVRLVFLALLQRGKQEVLIPIHCVESAKKLVDYLMETADDLSLYYDTPYKRHFQDGFSLPFQFDEDEWEYFLTVENDADEEA
jgi:hypothetical protein